MFKCDKCGLCCTHLNENVLYADLDDGSGTCKYFNVENKLCEIYSIRPLKCNVEKSYIFFSQQMSWDEYIKKNYEACEKLKRM